MFRFAPRDYLAALIELPGLPTPDERRAAWRQSMATLAHAASSHTPAPLEGLPPEGLLLAARLALADGLVDDLGFLEPSHAAAAVYELAAALPPSPEKRELGRRVLQRLHDGDAPTFVALATSLALGARRGLAGPAARARVALSLDLPIGAGVRADTLALALVSRRELVRDWLTVPSVGSLPSRRLAARLLERAAREAARRAADGDDAATRAFELEEVSVAWARLLADREPLVWRHVATARGLLSEAVPRLGEQIARDLRASLSPTEWRRAAASLAARVAVAPRDALAQARLLLEGDVPLRDPGVGAAMILGLARAAEVEPTVAEELLELCVRGTSAHGVDVAEALVELRRERVSEGVGEWATERVRAQLRDALASAGDDDGRIALIQALQEDLAPESERGALTLRERIAGAQRLFVEKSAREAFFAAREVVGAVVATVERLERADSSTSEGRQRAFRDVRDLDTALLETSALSDLLMLGPKADSGGASTLAAALARLSDWLLLREAEPVSSPVVHLTLRLRRLRVLLHLVDADGAGDDDANKRRLRATSVLLWRAREDAAPALRRTLLATLARATDGLVREEICEMSDVLVALLFDIDRLADLAVVAEASTAPDLQAALRAYIALSRAESGGAADSSPVAALHELARALPAASSPRVEALRAALLRLTRALEPLVTASGLDQLAQPGEPPLLLVLASATQAFAQLLRGARRRLRRLPTDDVPVSGLALRMVESSIERAQKGRHTELVEAVEAAVAVLVDELPVAMASVVVGALKRVLELPLVSPEAAGQRPSAPPAPPRARSTENALPPWLPPSRTLGGFYVLRAIGSGAGGTVFVVKRADERHDKDAELFALKVPDYDGAAARTLSEQEFHRLFREEAGALLALPQHPNLATFVTFDAGARPKPVLVMELVQGASLERRLEQQAFDLETAFQAIEGVAAGLEAMHSLDIGHLDVKPSNVIIRSATERVGRGSMVPSVPVPARATPRLQPVLVDFGLAGRSLRPGCATASYGAPEIWGLVPEGHVPRPADADVYAFACLVYEVLTGCTLFTGTSEVALLTAHLSHDGLPDALAGLARLDAPCRRLVEALSAALRRDPRERVRIGPLRVALARASGELAGRPWPLGSVATPSAG
jgi:hypothetical protein